ncbi:hypothetical protein FACS189413_05730 [Bacteroidia bacterium]|nr:hypothetical protein FACS189413_05730 [Bacteroidia bacterium]
MANDLRETGLLQRRDLSIPDSRIVINPFNFNLSAEITASEYNNSRLLPLNIGYLTISNEQHASKGRFGRELKSLLEIRKISKEGALEEASEFSTEWLPYALPFSAKYKNNTTINGYDFFYDENTIARISNLDKKEKYFVSGFIQGTVHIDDKNQLIIVNSSNYKYAVSFENTHLKTISFYASAEDLQKQIKTGKPENAQWWSMEISDRKQLDVLVSFALASEQDEILAANIRNARVKNNVQKAYTERMNYWNDFLKNKIPHPVNFDIKSIDSKGVTSEEIRLTYYKAWVLLAQNIIPPEGTKYPYCQMATGKASLWDEGHETAPFSATWESFVGLQLYAYIDVNVAWSCLKGLMSLVDETGMLGGESLPSRKAHSAWVLYELSKDKKSLQEVYPAIGRYLDWRIKQPRWIYGNETPENEKDIEFVASAIIDMEYMSFIAKELGKEQEATGWLNKRRDFIRQCKEWFWKTPQDLPVSHINQFPGRQGDPNMLTTALYIKEISEDYYESLLGLFYKYYDTDKVFAGFDSKYPDVDFSIYGLIQHRKNVLARGVIESNLRDIIRSRCVFAEAYRNNIAFYADGVRPSIFGMATVIDFVLLKNGYMYTKGAPCLVNIYPEGDNGVDNIPYFGKHINIHNKGEVVEVSGSALRDDRKEIEVKKGEMQFILFNF